MRARLALERRDPATGLSPAPFDGVCWDRFQVQQIIGTIEERRAFSAAHDYDVDAVLSASYEFRRAVIPPYGQMSRGEAIHIVRALAAVAR